ncbi:hypothetical protein F2Q69_00028567 [Brassica cretica]|uniref:Uncharacterized protein n=1 Tax=Brassica cretica TaxID=69181 RepID=A0A8S9RRF5_BRACR|nr:hypothetical protein F2Q69_00028567 [Brassica cretica]
MVPRENEWQDVGIAHRASPWRETQKSVSGNNIRTICPSRYLALNDIEEGELESSSSDEDDEAESSDPPQKEIKNIPQNANKAKTSSRNKAGTNPQSATPSFGCLIETRVQESKCDGIITTTLLGWKYLNNYDHHRLGKIWVVWSDNVSVTVLYKSAQVIAVWVTSQQGKNSYVPDFATVVVETWNATEPLYHSRYALHIFHRKLKLLKPVLRHNYFEAVAEATSNWNYWDGIEEQFLMQKSRITWLKLGDQNITFFYKIVQSRTAYNAIRKLVLSTGETITGPIAIKQADASYFAQFLVEVVLRMGKQLDLGKFSDLGSQLSSIDLEKESIDVT